MMSWEEREEVWLMHMRRAVMGAYWNIRRHEIPGVAIMSNMRASTTSLVLLAGSSCTPYKQFAP